MKDKRCFVFLKKKKVYSIQLTHLLFVYTVNSFFFFFGLMNTKYQIIDHLNSSSMFYSLSYN